MDRPTAFYLLLFLILLSLAGVSVAKTYYTTLGGVEFDATYGPTSNGTWNAPYVIVGSASSAPDAPTTGCRLYVLTSDNTMYARFSSGAAQPIATQP